MTASSNWALFKEYWPISLTMTLGSFVAGATAEGGAAVAFPVFTKVLHIAAPDARTFGLMIQAVGMTMAGIVILVRRVPILPKVILWVTAGGILGGIGGMFVSLPAPYPKILFTFTAAVFGLAVFISRWVLNWEPRSQLPEWTSSQKSLFFGIGIFGGIVAANTGSGIDMMTYVVLTLMYGINEKISTPTTVIIMALNSIIGFGARGMIMQDIGIAWSYWLVAIPIVIVGAPFGAYMSSRLSRDHIIYFLLTLIGIEFVSTLVLVPFTTQSILITSAYVIVVAAIFWGMLAYRKQANRKKQLPQTGQLKEMH